VLYLLVWLLTLPFWLLAPFGAAIALLLSAWLNQRLFMYDALAEHASTLELKLLRRQNGWPLYAMSALLGLLHFVPLVNFFAPVYMGLAFTHYALGKIELTRSEGTP
jgi:CysZ protein